MEKIERPRPKGDKESAEEYLNYLIRWLNRFYDAILKS